MNLTSDLWISSEANAATNGRSTQEWSATSVVIDSRKVEKGSLFIAIQGPNNNGHDYLKMVAEKGAVAAMIVTSKADEVEKALTGLNLPLLIVEDTTKGLYDLAKAARQRTEAKIIAITGSVGKTGTKEGLRLAFSALGTTHATEGNLNNEYGLPLTMARMPRDVDFAILEIGMNHPEEIRPLATLAQPDIAIITTIAPVHLEFFDGIQGIADAKSEIFDGLDSDGKCLLPREHSLFHHLRARARDMGVKRENIFTFGRHTQSSYKRLETDFEAAYTEITASYRDKAIRFPIFMPGDHWVTNCLAILGAVDLLGGDVPTAMQALDAWKPGKGRGERFTIPLPQGGTILLIDESYNASPPAMKAAFGILADMPQKQGKKIAIIGDMLELGESSVDLHKSLAKDLESLHIDRVFCCGIAMGEMFKILPVPMKALHADDSSTLFQEILPTLRDNDIILVKGSLGSKMVPVADAFINLATVNNQNSHLDHPKEVSTNAV